MRSFGKKAAMGVTCAVLIGAACAVCPQAAQASEWGGKAQRVSPSCVVVAWSGSYAVGAKATAKQWAKGKACQIALYRTSGKKLTKVRVLAKKSDAMPRFVGGKLYYAARPAKAGSKKISLCRCTKSGKSVKKLKTFKALETDYPYAAVYIEKITAKSCLVRKTSFEISNLYRYAYKSKKTIVLHRDSGDLRGP